MTHRIIRHAAVLLAAVLALLLGGLAIAPAASAHIPHVTVDCDGVHLTAVRYNPRETNTWSVTVNGVAQSGRFYSELDVTVPVPQDRGVYQWSAVIDAPGHRYDLSEHGSVGPCGKPPLPPPPPEPPVVPPPPPTPPQTRHAKVNVDVTDKCNCYRDKVKLLHGRNVRVKASHPRPTLWVFKVTGKKRDGVQYLLPSRIGGHWGWAVKQTYRVRTTNKVCPCKKRGTCAQQYPGYTPPHAPCRGKGC